jgi:3-hydroxyacyl-CoA dehydrogenase/enoyl-CoA hydratase/3-hydroxybutyryl-CoA epimerase
MLKREFGWPMSDAPQWLRDKVTEDPDVIDAARIFGTGFAPFRGGPIHYAKSRGIGEVVTEPKRMRVAHGERFQPDPGGGMLA